MIVHKSALFWWQSQEREWQSFQEKGNLVISSSTKLKMYIGHRNTVSLETFTLFSGKSYTGKEHTYNHTYLLARPLGAFQSQMGKAQWIKTRPQHRELRALLFTISVWVL